MRSLTRHLSLLPLILLTFAELKADFVSDLAKLHVETCGGSARLSAFKSLEATGQVSIGDKTLETRIYAVSPNRVRSEIQGEGLYTVQVYDGSAPPWQATLVPNETPLPSPLSPEAAKEFIRDSEFEDLLLAPEKHGRSLRYIGPLDADEGPVERIRISDPDGQECELWLDARTYFIVRQRTLRTLPGGRIARIETRFSDFRPVNGLILAHRIRVYGEGRKLHETELGTVHVNIEIDPRLFTAASLTPQTVASQAPANPGL